MPLMDQFWGDRYGHVIDPYGFMWSMATHVREFRDKLKPMSGALYDERLYEPLS